jgi:hypothetical protein
MTLRNAVLNRALDPYPTDRATADIGVPWSRMHSAAVLMRYLNRESIAVALTVSLNRAATLDSDMRARRDSDRNDHHCAWFLRIAFKHCILLQVTTPNL